MADKAIVTVGIGEPFLTLWRRHCQPSWEAYAKRHGYDIVLISNYIDNGPLARRRSPHWQKLLILHHPSVRKYDRVVWLDADIAINANVAPCVVSAVEDPKEVGVVFGEAPNQLGRALVDAVNKRQAVLGQTLNQGGRTWADVYRDIGVAINRPVDSGMNEGFNSGVMVLSPRHHLEVFEYTYANYPEFPGSWFENGPVSHKVVGDGIARKLDRSFNVNVARLLYSYYPFLLTKEGRDKVLEEKVVRVMLENSYFLHFLGGGVSRELLFYL